MRRPLNTRPGVAQPPMEPGERCLRWVPWLAPRPPEAVPLHDARGALALAGADDVDLAPGLEHLGGDLLADLVLTRVGRCAARQVPAGG
jgi:hypothetical protein